MSAEMDAGHQAPDRSQHPSAVDSHRRRREASAQQAIEAAILGSEAQIREDRPRRLPASSSDIVTQMDRQRARRRARRIVERRRSGGLR